MIYLIMFFEFFKIGLFTIGGGYAMIPLIKELVLKYEWMEEATFYDFIGVCESTPGPIAINMATYIGSTQGGILGSIIATLGVVLPSFIIILLIASVLNHLTNNKIFKRCIKGIKPVVMALILSTGVILVLKNIGYVNVSEFSFNLKATIVFSIVVLTYIIIKFALNKKMSAISIILYSAVLGILVMII